MQAENLRSAGGTKVFQEKMKTCSVRTRTHGKEEERRAGRTYPRYGRILKSGNSDQSRDRDTSEHVRFEFYLKSPSLFPLFTYFPFFHLLFLLPGQASGKIDAGLM